MSALRMTAGVGAALGILVLAVGALAADAGKDAFTGSKFSCLQYTNGQGGDSSTRIANGTSKIQANIARMWTLGYLAGYYKAENKLEMTDKKDEVQMLDALIMQTCKDNPQNNLLVIARALGGEPHGLPKDILDFAPGSYTCGQHVDAKARTADDADHADLVEMWAFAFVQGYKNVASPDLEIPVESKAPIIGAVNKACANNRAMTYMDLTALVADKVKLESGK